MAESSKCGVVVWLSLAACTLGACTPAPLPARPPSAKTAAAVCPPAPVPEPEVREGFVVDNTWPGELSKPAFDKLLKRAADEHSTALLFVHDGKLLHESNPLGKGDVQKTSWAMSSTKSVVALLIGRLVDAGVLELDKPLSETLIVEWKDTDKATITLRHLLNHTSGLDSKRAVVKAMKDGKLVTPVDIEGTGLAAEVVQPVGTKFKYNNQVADFLSVVVRRATKIRLDDALQKFVFNDLGVLGAHWPKKDMRGDPHAAGEFKIRPIDLAKIGQVVLDDGMWQGERFLSEAWMKQMLSPGQTLYDGCGLLWWRNGRGKKGEKRELLAYRADGYLGQYIMVVPSKKLVAVRMRDPERTSWKSSEYNYKEFMWDVLAVAGYDIPIEERR